MRPEERPVAAADQPASATEIFGVLWDAVGDLLGTASGALLMRRAAGEARATSAELAELVITREASGYHYSLPPGWSEPGPGGHLALRHLLGTLLPHLAHLTSTVAVGKLRRIPALSDLLAEPA